MINQALLMWQQGAVSATPVFSSANAMWFSGALSL
jgi:hypothetical protein